MKFESFSGSRRTRRQNCPVPAPVMVETMETRALLAAPQVLSPTGTIADSTPTITWEAVNNATSYDIWVTDVESRERVVFETGLTTTSFTPVGELPVGRLRIWAQANFANAPSTGWGAPTDVVLQVAPVITGPVNNDLPATPTKINSTSTPITWTSPPGAKSFEIFLSNQTTQTSQIIKVPNLVPVGDANGNPIPDGNGDVLRQEVRQYFLSGEVQIVGAAPQTIVGASNTTDIVITSVAHGLKTGEKVRITGVEGNTAANGTFYVTVLTADTFQLTGVTGNGSYTQGGTFTKLTELRSELPLGQYRAFIRTTDDAGRVSDWSAAYNFEVATAVEITRPKGATFQNSQKVTVAVIGTPTSGSYVLEFNVWNAAGNSATTYRTAAIPYAVAAPANATAAEIRSLMNAQVQAAVRAIPGFGAAVVTTSGVGPNYAHEILLKGVTKRVTVDSTETLNPGTISVSTTQAKGITLEWEPVEGATHYEVWVSKRGVANEKTALFNVKYLTTTSYELPSLLATDDYVFWVRARRLSQTSEIQLSGNPTAGTFTITLTTTGTNGKTQTTAAIPYNATEAQVQAAVRALSGFETAEVKSGKTAPNLLHVLILPQTNGPVTVTVTPSITPGTIKVTTKTSKEVVGVWSARSDFSTITTPVITGPVGVQTNNPNVQTVTSVRPTIEWTAVDGAGSYEVWVDRTASSSTYLLTTVSTNSYTFTTDILPGNYWVWVRAASATGETTAWSTPYKFTATGGAPVITFPVNGTGASALPTIQWSSVPQAASYEIQVAWIGVDFDYITESNLTSTNFTPFAPLNSGSYRVWVRAIAADGTAMRWSDPVNFLVDSKATGANEGLNPELQVLTALLEEEDGSERTDDQSAEAAASFPPQAELAVIENDEQAPPEITIEADQFLAPELIEQLAQKLAAEEWWTLEA
ncbi:MAG: ubiquitin-activating E1 FCCH domain-containing protein [Planctomycetaceae bacterium]